MDDNTSNPKIFCKTLIGGRRTFFTESFFEVINIRKNVKNILL